MLDQAWRLSPSVALRPEPFGALAYHFGNRRLVFLKRPELVAVVQRLAGHPDLRSVLIELGVREGQWSAYEHALAELVRAEVVEAAVLVEEGRS